MQHSAHERCHARIRPQWTACLQSLQQQHPVASSRPKGHQHFHGHSRRHFRRQHFLHRPHNHQRHRRRQDCHQLLLFHRFLRLHLLNLHYHQPCPLRHRPHLHLLRRSSSRTISTSSAPACAMRGKRSLRCLAEIQSPLCGMRRYIARRWSSRTPLNHQRQKSQSSVRMFV